MVLTSSKMRQKGTNCIQNQIYHHFLQTGERTFFEDYGAVTNIFKI